MILTSGFFSFEIFSDSAYGAARAHPTNEVRDFAFAVFPDFRARGEVMGLRVHGVVVLIGIKRIGNFARKFFGDGIVTARVIGLDSRRADDDFGAERFQEINFFLGLLVRNRENHLVAADGGDKREPHAGVAGRSFNDRAAGLEEAAFFRVVDHSDADAIFHRAAGIGVIGFDEDLRRKALVDAIEPYQRRASNGFEDVVTEHMFSGGAARREHRAGAVP